MATFSVTANELKYASDSSWSSGKARQGVYSTTRYEGAIRFSDIANYDFSNMEISEIKMKAAFARAGGSSNKYLTYYKAAKNAISGSISSMRGASIGSVYVVDAYDNTQTITFNSSTNSSIFSTLKSYFASGNQT